MNTKPLGIYMQLWSPLIRVISFNSASDRGEKINYLTENCEAV